MMMLNHSFLYRISQATKPDNPTRSRGVARRRATSQFTFEHQKGFHTFWGD